ncbi:MAG TPA: hypothetical protein VGI33_20490 [Paenibacillus sp.]
MDKLFNSINQYSSKVELLGLATSNNNKANVEDWIIVLTQIMNWQVMSDRSGVWTYYEVIDNTSANILITWLKINNNRNILEVYCNGIGKYEDEELMNEIDEWIRNNEKVIDKFVEEILILHKMWFYKDLEV